MSSKKPKAAAGKRKQKQQQQVEADGSDGERHTDTEEKETKKRRRLVDAEGSDAEESSSKPLPPPPDEEEEDKAKEKEKEKEKKKRRRLADAEGSDAEESSSSSSRPPSIAEKEDKKEEKQQINDTEDDDADNVFMALANAPAAESKDKDKKEEEKEAIKPPPSPSPVKHSAVVAHSFVNSQQMVPAVGKSIWDSLDLNDTFRKDARYFRNVQARMGEYVCVPALNDLTKKPEIQFQLVGGSQPMWPRLIEVLGPVGTVDRSVAGTITHPIGSGLWLIQKKMELLDRVDKEKKPIGPKSNDPFSHVYKVTINTEPTSLKTTGISPRNKKFDTEVLAYVKYLFDLAVKGLREMGSGLMKKAGSRPILLEKTWDMYSANRQLKKGKDKDGKDKGVTDQDMVNEWIGYGFENTNPGFYLSLPKEDKEPDRWREICLKPDPDDPSAAPVKKKKIELFQDAINEFPEIIRISLESPVWSKVTVSSDPKKKDTKFPKKSDYVAASPFLNSIYEGKHQDCKPGEAWHYNKLEVMTLSRKGDYIPVPESAQCLWPGDLIGFQAKIGFTHYNNQLKLHSMGHYTQEFTLIRMKNGPGQQVAKMIKPVVTDNEKLLEALAQAGEQDANRSPEQEGQGFLQVEDVFAASKVTAVVPHPSLSGSK